MSSSIIHTVDERGKQPWRPRVDGRMDGWIKQGPPYNGTLFSLQREGGLGIVCSVGET